SAGPVGFDFGGRDARFHTLPAYPVEAWNRSMFGNRLTGVWQFDQVVRVLGVFRVGHYDLVNGGYDGFSAQGFLHALPLPAWLGGAYVWGEIIFWPPVPSLYRHL